MNSRLLISVIMAIYKEPVEWMRFAIESILSQTYKNFEFIIINDNPEREENRLLLTEYKDKDNRIVIINNDTNIGLTKSLNKGLEIAKGEYIVRMDADDISMPKRFEKQLAAICQSDCEICHTGQININERGDVVNHNFKLSCNYSDLFLRNLITHSSVMFKRELLKLRNKMYNEEIKRAQDYELWTFLYLNHVKFSFIPEPLIQYRVSEQQISQYAKGDQWMYSRHSRSLFVYNYLIRKGIKLDLNNINHVILKIKNAYDKVNKKEREDFNRIICLLLYTQISRNCLYVFKTPLYHSFLKDLDISYKRMLLKAAFKKLRPYLILLDIYC